MKSNRILIIDDSSTIRRLCDNELSGAGYQVLMAATAEDGVTMARAEKPDLIILDHQLPGTTGYEVCCQLLQMEETKNIPVVASSTLRKKAYAEYLDCDNVVDMLPKPYTPEALIATIENAINTAQMVVQSQYDGSSVPEVINALGDADLSGAFGCFGLRELMDLLNNGAKQGVLEVEFDRGRVYVYVSKGRIQAVTASGIHPDEVARYMPEALAELAPVIKFTVAGRKGSEVDGLVELLNNKVLDPRLLKKLLRLQAAVLLSFCFQGRLKSFRFDRNQSAPSLFEKLPLDGSLLSFLVEAALICDLAELPQLEETDGFSRKPIRGQNLDRAGLSSRHMKLMTIVTEPATVQQIATKLNWSLEETRRVLHGFEMAELIERCSVVSTTKVFAMISDPGVAERVDSIIQNNDGISGKVVHDLIGLRLLLRRDRPDALVLQQDASFEFSALNQLLANGPGIRVIELRNEAESGFAANLSEQAITLPLEFDPHQLLESMLNPGTGAATAAAEFVAN